MLLVHRYLIRHSVLNTLSFLLIFVGLIWLFQSLRLLDIIINYHVSLLEYLGFSVFIVPDLIVYLLPSCLCLGMIMAYQKFGQHHFFSLKILKKPMYILGSISTVLSFLCNLYAVPWGYQKFKDKEHQLKENFSKLLIKKGEFHFLNSTTIYVKNVTKDQRLMGVFIQDPQMACITAEEGFIDVDNKRVLVHLFKGLYQDHQKHTLSFESFHFDLTPYISLIEQKIKRPCEMSLKNLLKSHDKNYQSEGHQRIIMSLFCFVTGLFGFFFLLRPFQDHSYFKTYYFLNTIILQGILFTITIHHWFSVSYGMVFVVLLTTIIKNFHQNFQRIEIDLKKM